MQDVCPDNSVKEMFVDIQGPQAETAVNGCGGAAGKGPGRVCEMGEGGICMLKICDNNYMMSVKYYKSAMCD